MSDEIRSFRDLKAWQKAMELCAQVYELSSLFPDAERFGLTAQIRRAVISVPSNIAEGYGRGRTHDYVRYLDMARGSLCEVETQLLVAERLRFARSETLDQCMLIVRDCDRLLNGLARAIRNSDKHGPGP